MVYRLVQVSQAYVVFLADDHPMHAPMVAFEHVPELFGERKLKWQRKESQSESDFQ